MAMEIIGWFWDTVQFILVNEMEPRRGWHCHIAVQISKSCSDVSLRCCDNFVIRHYQDIPQCNYNVAAILIIGCQSAITKDNSELFLVIETLESFKTMWSQEHMVSLKGNFYLQLTKIVSTSLEKYVKINIYHKHS